MDAPSADFVPAASNLKSTPLSVRQAIKKFLVISTKVRSRLLPYECLSLHELADFKLPAQRAPIADNAVYLSNKEPSDLSEAMLQKLCYLSIPDTTTIQLLVKVSSIACANGAQSLHYGHLSTETATAFPIWIVALWKEFLDAQQIVTKWAICKDWVLSQQHHRKSMDIHTLADETSSLMMLLPYGVLRPSGLSDTSQIHELSRYLGTNWLSEVHINDLLEILRREVVSVGKHATQIEGTPLTDKVIMAYNLQKHKAYATDQAYAWIRTIGDELVQKHSTLITAVYLGTITNAKHWVPLIISNGGATINYGDSLGRPIPSKLHDTYTWWLQQHNPAIPSFLTTLPVLDQTDSYSCGILTMNSLQHFVNPMKYPLVGGLKASVVSKRLKAFNSVSSHIIKRLDVAVETHTAGNALNNTPAQFTNQHKKMEFTFAFHLPSTPASLGFTNDSTPTKRPINSSNAPTPAASPSKKCLKPSLRLLSPLPSLQFGPLGSPNSIPKFHEAGNVFGNADCGEAPLLKQQKMTSLWRKATEEEKNNHNHRTFQHLREETEFRVAEMAWAAYHCKERLKKQNKESQQWFHVVLVTGL